ncbi:MAG: hypothetical protein P9M06_07885 [Candidatus Saelkia tenebricola]|nr:hypothetical protein [Candidatus Saelkia tenebricola]
MKKNYNIFSIAFLLLIYLVLLNFIQLISRENKKINAILAQLAGNQISIVKNTFSTVTLSPLSEIKVNFWKMDPETSEKGEYLGSATFITQGKLSTDVKNPELLKILENTYVPIGELSEEGTARDWQINYKPGSFSHLKAITQEAWRWNYIAETEVLSEKEQ